MSEKKITPKVFGAIIAAGLMSFCGVVIETAMNITFPTLMREFNVSTSSVQWMTTIYLLVVAVIVPLSAVLKRNFKTKSLFLTGNILFIIGLIIDACAPQFVFLLLGRLIQGIGTGIALPLMFNIILEEVPLEKRGTMMGVGSLITAVAPAIGPTFGGIVVSLCGWRYIFIFLLPILIISLLLGLYCIVQVSPIQKTKFDWAGLISIILFFVGLIYGFSNLGTHSILSWQVLGAWLVGIIGLVMLIVDYKHNDSPILNLGLLKKLSFSGQLWSFFLFQMVSLGNSFLLPNYIQLVNHQNPTIAGLLVLPGAALGAIFAPIGGRLLDKYGARKPILSGAFLAVISLLGFTLLGRNLSSSLIVAIYLVYMGGVGVAFGNIMTSSLSQISPQQQADGNAILNTLQQLSGATGTSLVAAIVAQSQVSSNMAQTTAIGSQHAFLMLFIFTLIVFASLFKFVKNSK